MMVFNTETLNKKDLEELITILDDEFKKYCNNPEFEKHVDRIFQRYTIYQSIYYARYGIFLKQKHLNTTTTTIYYGNKNYTKKHTKIYNQEAKSFI